MANPIYSRILLKLSGEVLAGKKGFGIDPEKAYYLANEVKSVYKLGIKIGFRSNLGIKTIKSSLEIPREDHSNIYKKIRK